MTPAQYMWLLQDREIPVLRRPSLGWRSSRASPWCQELVVPTSRATFVSLVIYSLLGRFSCLKAHDSWSHLAHAQTFLLVGKSAVWVHSSGCTPEFISSSSPHGPSACFTNSSFPFIPGPNSCLHRSPTPAQGLILMCLMCVLALCKAFVFVCVCVFN